MVQKQIHEEVYEEDRKGKRRKKLERDLKKSRDGFEGRGDRRRRR